MSEILQPSQPAGALTDVNTRSPLADAARPTRKSNLVARLALSDAMNSPDHERNVAEPKSGSDPATASAGKAPPPPKPVFQTFRGLPDYPALLDLRSRVQWVAWDYVLKQGASRWTKPPIDATSGRFASHSNPATWSTYDRAAEHARRCHLPGVGYVLSEGDGIGGFDLDGCRDPETGHLAPWAAEIVACTESYAEVSPSGCGVRIFVLGKPERAYKSDRAGVEIYARSRFLTVTGQHIQETPVEIRPAPRTLAALVARVEATNARFAPEKLAVPKAAAAQIDGRGANVPGRISTTTQDVGGRSSTGSGFFRAVNTHALSNLARWVPVLFPSAKAQAGTGGYRITSHDLGRDNEEDLSITPQGAVDYGLHDQGDAKEGRRTAIDLVIEHGGAPDAAAASLWLCDRLGVAPASLGWRVGAQGEQEVGRGPSSRLEGGDGSATAEAARGGMDPSATVTDRGLIMPAYRDRLDVALKPEKAPAFPVDALPTLMADMVVAMAEQVQAPETLCAHSVLSAATLVTQGLADMRLPTSGRPMPLSLFLLAVAASGERKTSCDGLALGAVATVEARLAETYGEDMRRFRADRAAFEGEVSKIKGDRKISREERQKLLRALDEPDEPTAPIIRATEPNLEGLLNLLAHGRPSLGVFTAEGGSFLGGHGMTEDAKVRTLTGLSTLYDSGSAQRVRARETVVLDGRRVSISLAAQAKVASALLGDELAQDQGFLGRFLVCYPDSRIGTREVRRTPNKADPRVAAFTDRVARLLTLQEEAQAPLRLPVLSLDDEAWEVFRAFAQAIENDLGNGRHWHAMRATAQRIPENVGRIAGVLHLFARGHTDRPVDGETMVAACEVGAFYLKEALRISGGVMVDAETQAVDDLAMWLDGRGAALISPSIIQQYAPRALRMDAKTARDRIRTLCEAGVLERHPGAEIDGKHYREVYKINRRGRH